MNVLYKVMTLTARLGVPFIISLVLHDTLKKIKIYLDYNESSLD